MFSFSQRTVVACRLFLSQSRRCLDSVISRGDRLFAQSTLWAHSEGLPASFTHFLLGAEFIGDCTRSLAQLDFVQRHWGHHLLGWALGTLSASVLYELAFPNSLRVSTGRALALFGRLHSLSSGTPPQSSLSHCPLVSISSPTPAGDPGQFGVGPRCSLTVTRRWLQRVVIALGFVVCGAVSLSSPMSASFQELCVPTCSTVRYTTPASILAWLVGTRPTWPRSMPRWFVCVLHQSSRRPHSLSVVLPRLCRFACPVVCSSPRGTNRSLFMDASTLGFSIRRIW